MNAAHYAHKRMAKPIRINPAPRMHVDMTRDAVRLQAALLGPRSTEKIRSVLLAVFIGLVLAWVVAS